MEGPHILYFQSMDLELLNHCDQTVLRQGSEEHKIYFMRPTVCSRMGNKNSLKFFFNHITLLGQRNQENSCIHFIDSFGFYIRSVN